MAAATALSASCNCEAAGPGSAESAPRTVPSWIIAKQRMSSARERRRRSQPRTVPAGTSRSAPIRPEPTPSSAATRTVPITSIASARRGAHQDGGTMWVRRQERQPARPAAAAQSPAQQPDQRFLPYPTGPADQSRRKGQASRPPARSAGDGIGIGIEQHGRPRCPGPGTAPRGARRSLLDLKASRNPDQPGDQPTTL